MEQKDLAANLKEQILDALIIDAIQNHITQEDYRRAIDRIVGRISGTTITEEPKKEEESKEVDYSKLPIRWHPFTNGSRKRYGEEVILTDGVKREGFMSRVAADDFLGQYRGYVGDRIKRGRKIFNADMKEYFVVKS